MATFPTVLDAPRHTLAKWAPAMFAVLIICCESQNGMGAGQTGIWLSECVQWSGHQVDSVALLNHILRKSGHFTGYGLLGLCFARGWLSIFRKRVRATWTGLRLRAGACGVGSAFLVASCDEFHQIFLPTRGASIWDVLLDTSGALTLALLLFGYLLLRRHSMIHPASSSLTTLGLSVAGLPSRMANEPSVLRLRQSADRRAGRLRHRIGARARSAETA